MAIFFCESFAHVAEQLLRNIPHCSASHATRFAQFAQKSKLCKIIFAKIKIAQNYLHKKLNFFAKTKSLRYNESFTKNYNFIYVAHEQIKYDIFICREG